MTAWLGIPIAASGRDKSRPFHRLERVRQGSLSCGYLVGRILDSTFMMEGDMAARTDKARMLCLLSGSGGCRMLACAL